MGMDMLWGADARAEPWGTSLGTAHGSWMWGCGEQNPSPLRCPGAHSRGNGSSTMRVLRCSGGAARCCPRVGFGLFFLLYFTFTFSQKSLPATCKSCHPQPLSWLPPTPFLSSPQFPFQVVNVTGGFLDPAHPLLGGCWSHEGLCPPPPEMLPAGPQSLYASVRALRPLQLYLPHMIPLWRQCDTVVRVTCHHLRDSVPPSWGHTGIALGQHNMTLGATPPL